MNLSAFLLPLGYTLLVWWFSTGLILYLDGLPKHTFRRSLAVATALLAGALAGIALTGSDATPRGAYLAFSGAVVVVGWVEMTFLMGVLTGPRKTPCPPRCSEWQRLLFATQAILYHECALILAAAAVVGLTWNAPNQVATWTFLILWVMRTSAKLNLFFGVRNLYESFLPDHLSHMKTYFTRRAMNLLLPVVVVAGSLLTAWLWILAADDGASAYEVTRCSLLATLLMLAVLEHLFLVLPLPTESLWQWALKSRNRRRRSVAPADMDGTLFAARD